MNKIEQIKAEIERLKAKYHPLVWSEDSEKSKEGGYKIEALNELMLSLPEDQPSEDLEVRKQIEELANDWHHKGFASDEDCPLCMQDLMDILWHFYELGLNARKED